MIARNVTAGLAGLALASGVGLGSAQAAAASGAWPAAAHTTDDVHYPPCYQHNEAWPVVRLFYAYINARNWNAAYELTNGTLGPYWPFVNGYQLTKHVTVTENWEQCYPYGGLVSVNIVAVNSTGSAPGSSFYATTYTGTYTVVRGFIAGAHIVQTKTWYDGGWYIVTGPNTYVGTIRPPGFTGGEPKAPTGLALLAARRPQRALLSAVNVAVRSPTSWRCCPSTPTPAANSAP
jgi:hypothetical protein